MAEPTTTSIGAGASITGSLVILLGPVIGPWVAVLMASIIGSLWTIGRIETESRLTAALALVRINLTSLVLTGIVAALLVSYVGTHLTMDHLLPAVSFCISAVGDKIKEIKESAVARFQGFIRGGQNP